MIVTESEARNKRCHVLYLHNRCVAGECMAWRWESAPMSGEAMVTRKNRLIDLGLHPDTATEQAIMEARGTGFCGLAGKP